MQRSLETTALAAVLKSSTIDYPGQMAAVLFTGWCNMSCPYCHNKDLFDMDRGDHLNLGIVLTWLRTRAGALTGVVISGGEPTMLGSDVLEALILELRHQGFKVKLDTNGTACVLSNTLKMNALPDYIAVDVKAPRGKYKDYVLGNEAQGRVAEDKLGGNLVWLDRVFRSETRQYELRTTVHRSLLSVEELTNLKQDWVARRKARPKWYLQQYGKTDGFMPELKDAPTYTDEELADMAIGLGAYVRGVEPGLAAKVEQITNERQGVK